jgi:N-formylglutamate deformylase
MKALIMSHPVIKQNLTLKSPILLSMPHCGMLIPEADQPYYQSHAFLIEDTDWYIPNLYQKAIDTLNLNTLENLISRYVIDVNRPLSNESLYPGQTTTGLFPMETFDGQSIYAKPLDEACKTRRIETVWQSYHQALNQMLLAIHEKFGMAILWDAHSIRSVVPRLFDGKLPDFNLGTFDGKSAHSSTVSRLLNVLDNPSKEHSSAYTFVLNGRFKGGYITRHYGQPEKKIEAIQLEMAQSVYLKDEFAKSQGKIPQWDEDFGQTAQVQILELMSALCKIE